MSSTAFLAVASAALFVLVFQGSEAADSASVVIDSISDSTSTFNTTEQAQIQCLDNSRHSPWLEYNRNKFNGGKICCVPTMPRNDYTVVDGVGAYKIYTRQRTWHEARKICLADGGQLAVMDTKQKHDLFLQWKRVRDIGLWIGFHDLFEEGTWVSVTGESIDSIGYYPWADGEPNDDGGQDCAVLWMKGLDDYKCTYLAGFICEINYCEAVGHRLHDSVFALPHEHVAA